MPEPNQISPISKSPIAHSAGGENVLDRLSRLTKIARNHGFEIRGEPLGGGGNQGNATSGGSTWCEIRGRRILFLDLSQPAAEQAIAIREILEETASLRPHAPAKGPNNTKFSTSGVGYTASPVF